MGHKFIEHAFFTKGVSQSARLSSDCLETGMCGQCVCCHQSICAVCLLSSTQMWTLVRLYEFEAKCHILGADRNSSAGSASHKAAPCDILSVKNRGDFRPRGVLYKGEFSCTRSPTVYIILLVV